MALKRLLRVRNTNDKILQVYLRESNDMDDGIYYNEIDRNSISPIPAGTEIVGTNIIKKSDVFPGEDVNNIVLDTNHLDHPSGYITSLCFYSFDGNTSKLYMGRVSSSESGITWTQCADSPKTYANSEIFAIYSSFLNEDGGSPVKTLLIKNPDDSVSIIMERH
jgi:hypothetical protein